MARYEITVHLSTDFRQTCLAHDADDFELAAHSGCYDGAGFKFVVQSDSHLAAAETAFGICNSYPGEMHVAADYLPLVQSYRREGNRSLSVGDLVYVSNIDHHTNEDGRYGCASAGFRRF